MRHYPNLKVDGTEDNNGTDFFVPIGDERGLGRLDPKRGIDFDCSAIPVLVIAARLERDLGCALTDRPASSSPARTTTPRARPTRSHRSRSR